MSCCSMFVFLSMLVLGMSEHAIGNYVLAGPRTPYWGCKRGCDGNYASRIKCRCGAAAPTTIMQKANRNAPTDAPKLTEHSNSFIFNLFQSTWTTKTRTGGARKESSFRRLFFGGSTGAGGHFGGLCAQKMTTDPI